MYLVRSFLLIEACQAVRDAVYYGLTNLGNLYAKITVKVVR